MMLHDSVIKRTTCVVSLVTIIAGYTNDAESYDVVMDISENYIEHLADMIGREASVRGMRRWRGGFDDLTMEGILSSTLQTCSVLTFTIYDTA